LSASPMRVLGEKIVAFIILRDGVAESPELAKEISTHVRKVLGPVAYPDKVYFVKDVPKTCVRQNHAPCHYGQGPAISIRIDIS
jgi:acyl-coenzyme A synthetase/AMP-(fatty) acid ligase